VGGCFTSLVATLVQSLKAAPPAEALRRHSRGCCRVTLLAAASDPGVLFIN